MIKEKMNDPYQLIFREYPDVISPEEMSRMLNISLKTAYKLLAQNVILSKKIGSHYIIAKKHVIDYLLN